MKNPLSIKKTEWALFGSMFFIVSLININFSILRSMRNALVVADIGGSSAFIPYFELFGTFPASILLTWGLSRLMRFFSFRFIFLATMSFFLFFFIVFAFWIYPYRGAIQILLENKLWFLIGFSKFRVVFTHWPDMIFYIMAELWKVAILSVLFWGFINQKLSLDEAKRFYPSLMLGSSVGAILAGPITVFCTSQMSWNFFSLSQERWQHSLYLLTFFLFFCGILTLVSFNFLFTRLRVRAQNSPETAKKEPFSRKLLSLSSSLRYLWKSPYLGALLLIVVAEYVAYSLGELIFLETLKKMYPTPSDYCHYMGNLTLWTGILTAFSALIVTPYLLQIYPWSLCALITPILMVLSTVAFFAIISLNQIIPGFFSLPIAVILGSLHFCVGRSVKYTLFDSTKELAFIPLNEEAQVKGKLIIDGIGSRFGRGASSLLSIGLFSLLGGPLESALFTGILAISFAFISLPASRFIGKEFETLTASSSTPSFNK
ncbi:MAG: NTP/NDP exchange transporter [Chlamydiae bacterium]|nr:NTP/NDP exchange transporter [Chlamydiota bacterium]